MHGTAPAPFYFDPNVVEHKVGFDFALLIPEKKNDVKTISMKDFLLMITLVLRNAREIYKDQETKLLLYDF